MHNIGLIQRLIRIFYWNYYVVFKGDGFSMSIAILGAASLLVLMICTFVRFLKFTSHNSDSITE